MKANLVISLIFSSCFTFDAYAGSATWKLEPVSNDWNTADNWEPATVPNGPHDVATFDVSNENVLTVSQNTIVGSVEYTAGANAFSITVNPPRRLTVDGAGLDNSSGFTQQFVTQVDEDKRRGMIEFSGSATVTGAVSITNHGSLSGLLNTLGGETRFTESSSAGDGVFYNRGEQSEFGGGGRTTFHGHSDAGYGQFYSDSNGLADSSFGFGHVDFFDYSTAANAYFENRGWSSSVNFYDCSTAGDATVVNMPAAVTYFSGGDCGNASGGNGMFINHGSASAEHPAGATVLFSESDAGNGIYIAQPGKNGGDGGVISFRFDSTGGTAKIILQGNARLDLILHFSLTLTIGSLLGDGIVDLGDNHLRIGADNSSSSFDGLIEDSDDGRGYLGSLEKIGAGKLTLTGASTYTGGTILSDGSLVINNTTGSGTGTGAVNVNAGTLGGSGSITGAVTVGIGSGPGAFLEPSVGVLKTTSLSIQSALTFKADSTYTCKLNTSRAKADKVIANGVTVDSGAQFNFVALGNKTLTPGKVFVAISNTAATPITGTFANLPDGSTLAVGPNTFQVSYSGGDGNDLSLTVVP